jgi:hypothetical protein
MFRTTLAASALALAGGLAVTAASVETADAQSRRGVVGYVETCSQYGNGCTSAPVRRGRNGYEYRLPGGTWIECRQNCRSALREDSVDFWETQRENQRDR